MSFFEAEYLTAGYGSKTVISNLSFSLDQGRLMGVLGANGSGKTTLMKAVCSILPHKGRCLLEGQALESLSPRRLSNLCSYIPQRSGISIDISVLDVVLMGFNPKLSLLEHPTAAMRLQAEEVLKTVGLSGMEDANYLHLSEGQKQLCILARTLAADSRLLLLDEPESALDFRFRYKMLSAIKKRLESGRSSALIALHDPMLALNFCDELLLLDGGKRIGIIRPGEDRLDHMEQMLSMLYGAITLTVCADRTGRKQLVMIKEEEESF